MNTSCAQEHEFANSTQADFAGTLDSYQIAWHYKPRTFAIEWDDDGNFVDSLTPDFYLPEYGQYVELASPESRFAEKNRCVLLLRRHHPEIRITLISPSEVDSLVERLILIDGKVHVDLSHLWTLPREATRASL
ncbi:MAG TPA: hypothetical protein VGL29_17670 [Blastocatellia bacterium]